MADVFLSYKRDERAAVETIASRLRDLGLTVWFDAGMSAGEAFNAEIDREARAAKAILVCWSPAARQSGWVNAEAMIGFEQKKLAACYVAGPDGFSAPTPFNASHAEDLRAWLAAPTQTHAGWRSVLRRIGKLCGRADIEGLGGFGSEANASKPNAERRDATSVGRLTSLRPFVSLLGVATAFAVSWLIFKGASESDVVRQEPQSTLEQTVPQAPSVTSAGTAARRPGQEFDDCDGAGWCPAMIVLPAGSFVMGSPETEVGREPDESPQHTVTIAQIAVGKFEVTFDEWAACVDRGGCAGNPSPGDEGWGRGHRPVINVSWNDTQEYARWLSHQTGHNYRLLTEAEWEYAARAGTSTAYFTGSSTNRHRANFAFDLSTRSTAPVGSFAANQFGLHDMQGNVFEWVQDCSNANYLGAPTDGSAWTSGNCSYRVVRGGAWMTNSNYLRSADRGSLAAHVQVLTYGFRVARTL